MAALYMSPAIWYSGKVKTMNKIKRSAVAKGFQGSENTQYTIPGDTCRYTFFKTHRIDNTNSEHCCGLCTLCARWGVCVWTGAEGRLTAVPSVETIAIVRWFGEVLQNTQTCDGAINSGWRPEKEWHFYLEGQRCGPEKYFILGVSLQAEMMFSNEIQTRNFILESNRTNWSKCIMPQPARML